MKRLALTASALVVASLLTGCGHLSLGRAALASTGYVSHQLCSAVFVAGRDPERYYRDAIAPIVGPLAFAMSHRINRERAEVRATVAGMAESRAVYRPPFGCVNATGGTQATVADTPAAPA